MPEFDEETLRAYAAAWKRRQELAKKGRIKLAEEARSAALKLAKLLISTYGASEVWLFGSLARSKRDPWAFGERSDIDLAARGLPPERYFHILSRINAEVDFTVDLIDMDACPPWLSKAIAKEGEPLAARTQIGPTPGGFQQRRD